MSKLLWGLLIFAVGVLLGQTVLDFSNATVTLPNPVYVGTHNKAMTFPSASATIASAGANSFTGTQAVTGKVTATDDVFVSDAAKGLVLKDTGGVCWRFSVAGTTGAVSTTSVTCP